MKDHPREKALEVVETGYDRIGERYSEERGKFFNREEVDAFIELLPVGGRVLDAGVGTGVPIARHLVDSGFDVTGIDLSRKMLAVAARNVPEATLQRMNMAEIDFAPDSFDGVISCYAIIHNPRENHAAIFESFHRILRPGGVMLVSVAAWAWEEFADYLGEDMFWSHYEPDESQALIAEAGFELVFARDVESGGEKHHWVLVRKSGR